MGGGEMVYTAIASVRDRSGNPQAVRVPAYAKAGDVIRFTRNGIPSLGFIHEIVLMDEDGKIERLLDFVMNEMPNAEAVWVPAITE
jgi:hypothetical protein